MSSPLLDPEYRGVRRAYIAFYCFALPLFVLALFTVIVVWSTWARRGYGVMEGPELSGGEAIVASSVLGIFALGYIAIWLWAPRITQPKYAWLPFAAHIPAMLALIAIYGRPSGFALSERIYVLIYLIGLLLLLSVGIFLTRCINMAARGKEA